MLKNCIRYACELNICVLCVWHGNCCNFQGLVKQRIFFAGVFFWTSVELHFLLAEHSRASSTFEDFMKFLAFMPSTFSVEIWAKICLAFVSWLGNLWKSPNSLPAHLSKLASSLKVRGFSPVYTAHFKIRWSGKVWLDNLQKLSTYGEMCSIQQGGIFFPCVYLGWAALYILLKTK